MERDAFPAMGRGKTWDAIRLRRDTSWREMMKAYARHHTSHIRPGQRSYVASPYNPERDIVAIDENAS